VFESSWENTTTAFWCKYPNKDLKHVKDALVLERCVDDNGVLYTRRLIHMEQKVPSILRKFHMGSESFFAIEDSTVDPKAKRMVLKTRNITYGSLIDATEVCTYTQSEENPSNTDYSWTFTAECKRKVPLLTGKIESTLTDRAKMNSGKGLKTMEELSSKFDKFALDAAQKLKLSKLNLRRLHSLSPVTAVAADADSLNNGAASTTNVNRFQFINLLANSLFK